MTHDEKLASLKVELKECKARDGESDFKAQVSRNVSRSEFCSGHTNRMRITHLSQLLGRTKGIGQRTWRKLVYSRRYPGLSWSKWVSCVKESIELGYPVDAEVCRGAQVPWKPEYLKPRLEGEKITK